MFQHLFLPCLPPAPLWLYPVFSPCQDLPVKHSRVKLHSRGQGQALIFSLRSRTACQEARSAANALTQLLILLRFCAQFCHLTDHAAQSGQQRGVYIWRLQQVCRGYGLLRAQHPEEQRSSQNCRNPSERSILEEVMGSWGGMGRAAWEPRLAAGQPPVTLSSERISFLRHTRFPERRETRKTAPEEFPL